MKKSEFIKKCNQMENPVLSEKSLPYGDLLSCYLTLEDKNLKVIFPAVRLSHPEYDAGNLRSYYKRERKMKLKYLRWCEELFGNYFDDQIAIYSQEHQNETR